MRNFVILKDANGNNTGWAVPSDHVANLVLEAGEDFALTIPDGARLAVITADHDCWVNFGGNAAAAPSASIGSSGSCLVCGGTNRTKGFGVVPGDVMSVESESNAQVEISFYS
ncbi:MAG: hypothetical protein SVS15_04125 [Thermodesulfobacteriota bacterium]|nr:hypothetical protein [Thermodesulfobacteriota bacterium]